MSHFHEYLSSMIPFPRNPSSAILGNLRISGERASRIKLDPAPLYPLRYRLPVEEYLLISVGSEPWISVGLKVCLAKTELQIFHPVDCLHRLGGHCSFLAPYVLNPFRSNS